MINRGEVAVNGVVEGVALAEAVRAGLHWAVL